MSIASIPHLRMFPKTDLHVHFEGLIRPLQFEAACREPTAAQSIFKPSFEGVPDLIHSIRQSNEVLLSKEDCADAVRSYLKLAHAAGVCHVELAFEPEFHKRRGLDLVSLLGGICSALEEGKRRLAISSYLILSVAQDQSPEIAFENLACVERTGVKLKGVGIAGYNNVQPLREFRPFMVHAAERGYKILAHAGEGSSSVEIWEAIREFPVDRIDHGIAAIEDTELLQYLRYSRLPLATAPMSNQLSGVGQNGSATAGLLREGILVSVNTDDPGIQQTTIIDDYRLLIDHQSITNGEMVQLVSNGFESSFLPSATKEKYLATVRALAGQYTHE